MGASAHSLDVKWASPDFDRLLDTFNTTLVRGDWVVLVRQMLELYSQDLPWDIAVFPCHVIRLRCGAERANYRGTGDHRSLEHL